MPNQYDNAIHHIYYERADGKLLARHFMLMIDGKNMADIKTGRYMRLVGDIHTSIKHLTQSWAFAGISSPKYVITWFKGKQPEWNNHYYAARLLVKRDKQVWYNDDHTEGSHVTTFMLELAPNPESLAPHYPDEMEEDSIDDLLAWLHDNYGLHYAWIPSPGGVGTNIHFRQAGRFIKIETRTWRDC